MNGKTTAAADTPRQNRLLAALPSADYERLLADLELVRLQTGKVVYEPGLSDHVQFPTTSIVSLLSTTKDGCSAETAIIGRDGMVGFPVFRGAGRAVAQNTGYSYQLKTTVLNREFERSGALQNLLLGYTLYLLGQTAQNTICNRHHSVLQQFCRALLTRQDRSPSNELSVTHDQIAHSLGVRRESVTLAAGFLRSAGLIDYRRGRITVLDRTALEAQSCECYPVLKEGPRGLFPLESPGPVIAPRSSFQQSNVGTRIPAAGSYGRQRDQSNRNAIQESR
jgi:CRP-like cAMP-binding protein